MSSKHEENAALDKLRHEMRRGALVLTVLSALRTEQYGYSLRKELAAHDIHIDEGTLYPLVRRLEKQGLLTSDWREENNRKKRFYQLSSMGARVYEQLRDEWRAMNRSIVTIIEKNS